MGSEKGRFPPVDTWTPEEQAVGRELTKALAGMAVTQAMRSMRRHLEAMQAEGYAGTDPERTLRSALSPSCALEN